MKRGVKAYLLCLMVILLCFTGISRAFAEAGLPGPMGTVSDFLFRPVQNLLSHIRRKTDTWLDHLAEAEAYRSENEQLKRQLALYRDAERKSKALQQENMRLERLLQIYQEEQTFAPVACRVIAKDAGGITGTFRIDKGTRQGIGMEDAVICTDGLVGRISAVYGNSAVVTPYTEMGSHVAVRIVRNQALGVTKSENRGLIYTGFSEEDMPIQGDAAETSGMGGIYPAGILVGTVSAVTKEGISMTPSVNIRELCEVLVLCEAEKENV